MAKRKKKKSKSKTKKIKVVKVEEKRKDQVKKPKDYKPAISKMYQDDKGKPLDLSKLKKVRNTKKKKLYIKIIIVLLMLFGAAVAGFFVFYRNQQYKEGDVALEISGPENISSGDEVVYTINYANQGEAFLGNVKLTATYPEGFTFKSSVPEADNTYNQYWEIGDLNSGKQGQLKITGKLVGEVGSTKTLNFKMSYKPSNFNSLFESKTSYSTKIDDSIINLEIDGSKRVILGREANFKIKYKNESKEPIEKFRIEAVYPEDYEFISSSPEAYEGNNIWQIERLEASNQGEIEVKGKYQGSAGDMREMKIKLGLVSEDGQVSPQVEESVLILLIEPELNLDLKINGKNENITASPGERLTYYLSYKNNSDIELKDMSFSLDVNSDKINWNSLDDDQEGNVEEGKITWTKDQIKSLESVKPDDEGEIIFKLDIKENIELENSDDKNFQIENIFSATSSSLSELGGESISVKKEPVVVKINSLMKLDCEARYYSEENEKLGSGPLPPEVGETTTYRLLWYLTNTSNELKDVLVTSTLPEDIFWTGKNKVTSAGSLNFDPISRQISWQINRVPIGAGEITSGLSASFEVSTTPSEDDLGLVKVLCDKAQSEAVDNFTEATLNSTCSSITSELKNDINAQGQGIVISGE